MSAYPGSAPARAGDVGEMVRPGPARVANIVVDCADLDVMAAFWGAVLGARVVKRERGEWLDLEPLADASGARTGAVLSFQQVQESKQVKNRLHLDVEVAGGEFTRWREFVAGLGATEAGRVHAPDSLPWQVWRDPEGNEFCLVTPA